MDWGNVPAWVGAVLTSGSVFAAFLTMLRGQRRAEREQANQVHVVIDLRRREPYGCEGSVSIHNRSTAPIYLVRPLLARIEQRKWRRPRLVPLFWMADDDLAREHKLQPRTPYLLDGWKVTYPVRSKKPAMVVEVVAEFRDASGRHWLRASNGETIPNPIGKLFNWTEEASSAAPTPVPEDA